MKSRIHDLIQDIQQEQKLPDILSGRCVHGIIETASCRSCVEICPQGAWLLDDDALRLDTDACDGCGLCMSACPERAIQVSHEITIGLWRESSIALCACEYASSSETGGVIPCVHAIGLQEILHFYHKGVFQWVVTTADCNSCARGMGARLSEKVNRLNGTLQATGKTGIRYKGLSPTQWQVLYRTLDGITAGPQLSRRGFLTGLVSTSVRQGMELFGRFDDEQGSTTPPGQLLSRSTKTFWPFLPVIDDNLCNGCDACIRLCPHDAIRLELSEERSFYQLSPENCTGCGICVDICEQQAVKLYEWSMQDQQEIPLIKATCKYCGNPFHTPTSQSADKLKICMICSEHNHYKNLHQVLNAEQ